MCLLTSKSTALSYTNRVLEEKDSETIFLASNDDDETIFKYI